MNKKYEAMLITLRNGCDNDRLFLKRFKYKTGFGLPNILVRAPAFYHEGSYIVSLNEFYRELNELYVKTKSVYDKLGRIKWFNILELAVYTLQQRSPALFIAPFVHLFYNTNHLENFTQEAIDKLTPYMKRYFSEVMYFHFLKKEFSLSLAEIWWGLFIIHAHMITRKLPFHLRQGKYRRWKFTHACFKNLFRRYPEKMVKEIINYRYSDGILVLPDKKLNCDNFFGAKRRLRA